MLAGRGETLVELSCCAGVCGPWRHELSSTMPPVRQPPVGVRSLPWNIACVEIAAPGTADARAQPARVSPRPARELAWLDRHCRASEESPSSLALNSTGRIWAASTAMATNAQLPHC